MKYFNLIAAFLCGAVVLGQPVGTPVEGVSAVVGKNIILKSEIDAQYEAFKRQSIEGVDISVCTVLEDQLFQKLLVHWAEIDSVMIGADEVESNMDRRIQQLVAQMGGDSRNLEEYYGKSIIEIKEEMRPLMSEQLTAQRMQYQITENVEITPTEIQMFYYSIPQDSLPLINTEVEVAQIVRYPIVSREAEEETITKLNELKGRIEGGSSFASMAILYSEDPGSNKNGGMYKGIKRGQFVKEFEAVAFNLQPNEVSDPFKTEYGYHIVQLIDKRGEELDLRHILIKPKLSQEDLAEARNFLDSLKIVITEGNMTWEEAANEFSDDKQTKFNGGVLDNFETGATKFEISQLERSMFNAIKELEPGEISAADFFRSNDQKEAFRLVKLVNRIEPHKANMRDDYQQIKMLALQEKQTRVIDEWITEKIGQTYIKINLNYFPNCEVDEQWINTEKRKL